MRRIVNGCATLSFISAGSRVVLNHQSNWVISCKELEAAKVCSDLMWQALKALEDLSCTVKFWTDSQVVHKWITNLELHLSRFVKRLIDKIILVSPPDSWHYVGTSINPADVDTREKSLKNWDLLGLLLDGPEFLLQGSEDAKPVSSLSTVQAISVPGQLMGEDCSDNLLKKLIETSPNLYALKKRFAYLLAFKEFIAAKSKKIKFEKPKLDATYLNFALMNAVRIVQFQSFRAAITCCEKALLMITIKF